MLYKSGLDCKWNVNPKFNGFNGEGGGFAANFYEAMPEGRTFASLSTLAEKFSQNKKLFSIVKSFSILGNLFTILNSLNMERKGGTSMLHPFYLLKTTLLLLFLFSVS